MISLTIIKYFLIMVISVASAVTCINPNNSDQELLSVILEWWKRKLYKTVRFAIIAILAVITVALTAIDDFQSSKDQDKLLTKISDQSIKLDAQSESLKTQELMLTNQVAMLSAQTVVLADQQKMMLEQSKSVDSLLFNTYTSSEGKGRFLQTFNDFARIASIETDNTGFEGLVCDDGVAMYWFDVETETITGFHFFSNSEINRILCGSPILSELITRNGQYSFDKDSEIAIALKECLFKRLAPLSSDPIVAEQTRELILREIRTLLRYVYRAQDIEFKPLYEKGRVEKLEGRFMGSYSVWFQYVVNPNAELKRYNNVSLLDAPLSKDFLDSLHGLTIAEFSEKVIERFRNVKLEPKVRVKDIRILEKSRLANEWREASPFATRRTKH